MRRRSGVTSYYTQKSLPLCVFPLPYDKPFDIPTPKQIALFTFIWKRYTDWIAFQSVFFKCQHFKTTQKIVLLQKHDQKAARGEEMFGCAKTRHKGLPTIADVLNMIHYFFSRLFSPRSRLKSGIVNDRSGRSLKTHKPKFYKYTKTWDSGKTQQVFLGTQKQPSCLFGISRRAELNCQVLSDVKADI